MRINEIENLYAFFKIIPHLKPQFEKSTPYGKLDGLTIQKYDDGKNHFLFLTDDGESIAGAFMFEVLGPKHYKGLNVELGQTTSLRA